MDIVGQTTNEGNEAIVDERNIFDFRLHSGVETSS
jgi:hypothetical protein